MNNLLTYCGLVDPRISASDKDLPVIRVNFQKVSFVYHCIKKFERKILNDNTAKLYVE